MQAFRWRLSVLLILTSVLVNLTIGQTPVEEHRAVHHYVDSVVRAYSQGSAEQKKQASLPLWCLVHLGNDFTIDISEHLEALDTNELTAYIRLECAKPQNQDYAIDYELLRWRKRALTGPIPGIDIHPKALNQPQKAIYWRLIAPRSEQFNMAMADRMRFYKRSLEYADTLPNLFGLRQWLYRDIGYYYFHAHQLDSAIHIYKQQRDEALNTQINQIDYIKGFGHYINRTGTVGQALMHVAMCTEKTGNLTEAIRLYELAIAWYRDSEDYIGENWGKCQLMNSFIDLGDVERAKFLFRELIDHVREEEGFIDLTCEYLRNAFTELSYYDLVEMADFIQPILIEIEAEGGPLPIKPLEVGDGLSYFRMTIVYTYLVIIENLSAGTEINPDCLRNFQRLEDLHKQRVDTVSQKKEMSGKSIEALNLAWKVGLSERNRSRNMASLEQLIYDKSASASHRPIFKMVLMILHGNRRYQEELDLLIPYFKTLEAGGFITEQMKLHYQTYKAYEGIGNTEKALAHFVKYDSLWHATISMSQYTQLAELDKKLELERERTAKEALMRQQLERDLIYQGELERQKTRRDIAFVITGIIMLLSFGLYSRLRYIRTSKATLQKEKDRSESLLLNILPSEIAQELKEKGRAEARDFEMVSILFTDFKGFTEHSAQLSATDLVNEINECFEAFDDIMEKYGIEKIKTIGDAYMAAGGLPIPTDDSVRNTVLAALEMQGFIEARLKTKEELGQPAFRMRVGIHTGPVVAGIVGVKKFQYDVWGDTVNTASRIENNGRVGKVNISRATYELIKDEPQFAFESRGKLNVKGKGELVMYFVELRTKN